MVDSPFAPVLSPHAERLPAAFREQFLTPVDSGYDIVLEGEMESVWHRPGWLWPLLWISARFDMLFPDTGRRIPAIMVISGGTYPGGRPYQTWRRMFRFATARRFNATMLYDDRSQRLMELLGPGNALQLAWGLRFAPPLTIEIWTGAAALRLWRWRIPLPRWLSGTVRVVETAHPDRDDTIHVDLIISHALLGRLFGYEGTFRVRRQPRAAPPR